MNRTLRLTTDLALARPALAALAAIALLAAASPAKGTVVFTDISASAGVATEFYQSQNVHSLGPNWIDYDNDNLPDLFMVGGNSENTPRLFHNDGNNRFSPAMDLLPVLPAYEMSGSVFADYDNDGDLDIYIYTDHRNLNTKDHDLNPHDGPPNLLLKNLFIENGQKIEAGVPLFEEVAEAAGVDDLAVVPYGPDWPGHRAKTASWLDYDRDGCVDLYVGHWVMWWGYAGIEANRDRLYRNNCDGTFSDVTLTSGIVGADDPTYRRATLALIGAHFDEDLWPDLYVVTGTNEADPHHWDFYFGNNGDGTFTDRTITNPEVGDDAQAGMGIDVADVDHDGDWDFYITDLRSTMWDDEPKGNIYYLGLGGGVFSNNLILDYGVQADRSWGTNFFDIDHDGFEDLFVAAMSTTDSFIFMNNEGAGYTDVWGDQNLTTTNLRGSATADSERDGDVDLMVVNQQGPAQLWSNDSTESGNWLQLRLIGTLSNWAAIGTVVEVNAGAFSLKRQIKGGSSGHGQDDLVVHFGLAAETAVDEIRVRWPSGLVDVLQNVDVNGLIAVVEGSTIRPRRIDTVSAHGIYVHSGGADFAADQPYLPGAFGYTGGERFFFDFEITNTTDDPLYQSMRGADLFSYTFDLPAGVYAVDFHFMEPYFNFPGLREFDVTIEGVLALDNYDISLNAGGRRAALVETVFASVTDGQLNIDFDAIVAARALVAGITVREVSFTMNAGGASYYAESAPTPTLYAADQAAAAGELGYSGGRAYIFAHDVAGTDDDDLYLAMRAGRSFGYSVDGIPNGSYEIELFFTEPYLKPGRRQFDVVVEGQVLLEDFDISGASGGRFIAHSELLNATVADGELNIDFDVTLGGKALVSGIRVTKIAE